ncbi:MAG: DUF962 domain-containing protein [Pseudomonadota bacterium]
MKTIKTYQDFWPYYLQEHAQPATRAWHYFGTALAVAVLIFVIATGRWMLLPLALVSGYFFAWVSHGLIERNKPATFTYPLWSLMSDFRMLWCFLTGQMGKELRKAGVATDQVAE